VAWSAGYGGAKVSAIEDRSRPDAVDARIGYVIEERTEATKVPRLWSVKAIAARWCLSRMQVYRAHRAGRLHGYRVLGTLRFLESDVLALLLQEGVPVERGHR